MLQLRTPDDTKTIMLHSCCAPCSTAIIRCLIDNDIQPIIFYYNPNIFPLKEYEIRKSENKRYASSLGIEFIDADYDHQEWKKQMSGLELEPERGKRCLKCFTERLLETAKCAFSNDISVFTTSLASSRWKSLEQINEAGRIAASKFAGTIFWEQNWRKGGLNELRSSIIKEYDFYNQKYCGCEYSIANNSCFKCQQMRAKAQNNTKKTEFTCLKSDLKLG